MNATDTTTPSIEQRKRELTERWRGVCQRLDLHTSSSDRAAAIEELRAVEAAAMRLILAEAEPHNPPPDPDEPPPAWAADTLSARE